MQSNTFKDKNDRTVIRGDRIKIFNRQFDQLIEPGEYKVTLRQGKLTIDVGIGLEEVKQNNFMVID